MQNLLLDPGNYSSVGQFLSSEILHRIQLQPFNLVALIIFTLALCHTFFAHRLTSLAIRPHAQTSGTSISIHLPTQPLSFRNEMLLFIGELEVVFGIWCIPLLFLMTLSFSWETTLDYLNRDTYQEALFMVVAVAIASTKPLISWVDRCFAKLVYLTGNTPRSWWFWTMTVGPLLGSLVKESVAMTIAATLLSRHFFCHRPKKTLAYATVALLFVNISIGGTLSNFANSAVYLLAKPWGWTSGFLLTTFGWKALLSILLCNGFTLFFFRHAFSTLAKETRAQEKQDMPAPFWVTAAHILFLGWLIWSHHHPIVFLGSFALFLGFYQATAPYQKPMHLREPILIGFFIASLMIHGTLQVWWVEPILQKLSTFSAMRVSLFLSAFTHNTLITYLATQIPQLSEEMKIAIFTGTISGGGLTLMANGPNLVGYHLLRHHFSEGLSPLKIFIAALAPTLLCYAIFSLFF